MVSLGNQVLRRGDRILGRDLGLRYVNAKGYLRIWGSQGCCSLQFHTTRDAVGCHNLTQPIRGC